MNLTELTREFDEKQHLYERLRGEALFVLEQALKKTDIRLHSLLSRVKERDSFLEKAQRRQGSNPFEEIKDIVGLRVVCLFLTDIVHIGELIRNSFVVLSEDNKIERTDASSFGYLSVHFIVTMKKEYAGPRYDSITNVPFEVQVRTIAMDAWANVSHYLDYKSDKDIPNELKRDFYALSGLFYVADKHFEMFYGSRNESRQKIDELFDQATPQTIADQEINLDSLMAYLSRKFPDRKAASVDSISSLIVELTEAGFQNIGDIDRVIDSSLHAFLEFEKEYPNSLDGDSKYDRVAAVRACASLVDEKFIRIYVTSHFRKFSMPVDEEMISERARRFGKYRPLVKPKGHI